MERVHGLNHGGAENTGEGFRRVSPRLRRLCGHQDGCIIWVNVLARITHGAAARTARRSVPWSGRRFINRTLYTKGPNEQDYSVVERGRGAGTQARSESGPYRRGCALSPAIDRCHEAWPSGGGPRW